MSRDASWFGRVSRNRRSEGDGRRRRPRLRPAVLELEKRWLLATITVTNTAASGAGSLAAAVSQADSDGQANTIVFNPSDFTGHPTIALSGTLELSDTAGLQTITGPAGGVTISGQGKCQVFQIDPGVTATLTGLTISGGNLDDPASYAGYGSGLSNDGTVTITGCSFSGNSTPSGEDSDGGGLYNGGTATIIECSFSDNSGSQGGGLYNAGTATIAVCSFNDNSTPPGEDTDGGGLYNSGTVTIADSSFSDNSAGTAGGGLYSDGTAMITACSFSGNTAGRFGGGGLYSYGLTTITGCTISDNSAAEGGGVYNADSMTITGCTISGNSAASGGGISSDSRAAITQCTFSGNSAQNSGGALAEWGETSDTLLACTISGNSALSGGGLYLANESGLSLDDTIVAGNTAGSPSGPGDIAGPDADDATGWFNLIGTGGSGGIQNGQDDDIVLTSLSGLGLAPLGHYGGPTQTMALLPGSPAIDAGGWNTAVGNLPSTDQRGISRPQGTAPDIGAFQSQGFTITVTQGNGQSTTLKTTFAQSLEVTVTSAHGEPVQGGVVTFAAPGSGASASLSAHMITLGTAGMASVKATAKGAGGTYTVTASAGGAAMISFSLTNLAQPVFNVAKKQAITYGTDSVTISGSIAAGQQVPSGDVAVTLDGATRDAAIATNGRFSTTFTFATAPGVAGSPYPVSYAFTADGYFLGAQGTGELTVNPALLTVTARNQSMNQGGAVPALTYKYTGLVNGDQSATFTGGLATTATSSSPTGNYSITQGNLAATGDYKIGTFHAGTLTIKPASQTVGATNQSVIRGGPVAAPPYTFTGPVDGDQGASFTGALATSGSAVGNDAMTRGTLVATGDDTIVALDPGTLAVGAPPTRGAAVGATTGSLTDAAIDGLMWEADFAESLGTIPPDASHPRSAGWLS